jgi:hypothetical protein
MTGCQRISAFFSNEIDKFIEHLYIIHQHSGRKYPAVIILQEKEIADEQHFLY